MARKVTLTHKGWLGLCPVYLANPGAGGSDVHERHWTLAPLLLLSLSIYELCFTMQQLADPTCEPRWPLKVTGKLARPVQVDVPEDDSP